MKPSQKKTSLLISIFAGAVLVFRSVLYPSDPLTGGLVFHILPFAPKRKSGREFWRHIRFAHLFGESPILIFIIGNGVADETSPQLVEDLVQTVCEKLKMF